MAAIELQPELLERGPVPKTQEFARYEFNVNGEPFTVVIGGPDDFRLPKAVDIEVDTFAELGDLPEEVREEFEPYRDSSIYLYVHKTQATPEGTDSSQLMGMGRLIPQSAAGGVKTFNDLGEIAAKTPNFDTRTAILGAVGLQHCIIDSDAEDCTPEMITKRVETLFSDAYNCADLSKVIDIATLAPDMNLSNVDKFNTIDALLRGMALYTTQLYRDGKLTHLVQFTASDFHNLLKISGLPVKEMLGLRDLPYDSFGNGTTNNMVATPSVLKNSELDEVYFAPQPDDALIKGLTDTVKAFYAEK